MTSIAIVMALLLSTWLDGWHWSLLLIAAVVAFASGYSWRQRTPRR